ncbi:biotin transporter BioY [Spirochaeta cellobiosiphila]|uniref:biotin transporter BioY n=1 Tax=Spirochaeta cellobiosiphila TaxID=504483 RepID=UPI00042745FC|nr:biotin transporter BioY [Spirochaeta cellobiosiphila]
MKRNDSLKLSILAALFAALTAVGSYITVPVGPVPFVLANMFVLMSGLLLGPLWGVVSMGLYLLLGIIGLPVFAGATSGVARFLGPTGGFLFGYLLAPFVVGLVVIGTKRSFLRDLIAMILGAVSLYAIGIPWLNNVTGMNDLEKAAESMIPYMAGDVVKALLAALLAQILYVSLGSLLPKVSRHAKHHKHS